MALRYIAMASRHYAIGWILIAGALLVAPNVSASDGCWYTGQPTSEQEILEAGTIFVDLLYSESSYSDSCSPSDTQTWSERCSSGGADEATIYTPPVTIPRVALLGIPIVEEQTIEPQPVPIQEDPEVQAVDDPVCLDFGPGGSNPVVVGIRLTMDGSTLILMSDDFEAPACTDPAAPEFPCEDIVGALLGVVFSGLPLADTNDDGIPETLWLDKDGDGLREDDRSEDVPGGFINECFTPGSENDVVCYGGNGDLGILVRIALIGRSFSF